MSKEAGETLDGWENAHRERIAKIREEKPFTRVDVAAHCAIQQPRASPLSSTNHSA